MAGKVLIGQHRYHHIEKQQNSVGKHTQEEVEVWQINAPACKRNQLIAVPWIQ